MRNVKQPNSGKQRAEQGAWAGEEEAGSCYSLGYVSAERWQGTLVPYTYKPVNRLDRTLCVINHNSF